MSTLKRHYEIASQWSCTKLAYFSAALNIKVFDSIIINVWELNTRMSFRKHTSKRLCFRCIFFRKIASNVLPITSLSFWVLFFSIFLRRNLLSFQTIFGSKLRAQPRRMRSTSVRVVSSQGVLRSEGSHPVQGLELAEGARGEQNRGAKVARLEIEITGKLSFLCIWQNHISYGIDII